MPSTQNLCSALLYFSCDKDFPIFSFRVLHMVITEMASNTELTDEQYRELYVWIDAIPLSRPKRNIARDFSDGVLLAEVVAVYFPHLVEIHNYPAANSQKQKIYNFETLNNRVLKKLGFTIPRPVIEDIVNCKPGAVENVLNTLQYKMAKYRERKQHEVSPSRDDETPSARSSSTNQESVSQHKVAPSRSVGGVGQVKNVVDQDILMDKEQQIRELQETVEILELKVAKLEQLVRLKDNKIQKLMGKTQS